MSWGINGRLVTRDEMNANGIGSGFSYKTSPGTWSGDNRCISAQEARQYLCCVTSSLPADRMPWYEEFVRVYSYSLKYGSTCQNACDATSYSTYYSPCSSLTTGCYLYTDCQCGTQASNGYYVDSSNNCYEYSPAA